MIMRAGLKGLRLKSWQALMGEGGHGNDDTWVRGHRIEEAKNHCSKPYSQYISIQITLSIGLTNTN